MNVRALTLLAVAALGLASGGCLSRMHGEDSEPEKAATPMGDKAPEFKDDWDTFLVGKWGDGTGKFWTFNAGGTFVFREVGEKYKVEGKWTRNVNGASLQYLTMDGKSMTQAREESRAGAEQGGQAGIINDMMNEFVFDRLPDYNQIVLDEGDKRNIAFLMGTGFTDPATGESTLDTEVLERYQ